MTRIVPTVGRVVWIRNRITAETPEAALVAFVTSDYTINVGGVDHKGRHFSLQGIPLVQEGDQPPHLGPWAEWMPYQIGQAAKTEKLTALNEAMASPIKTRVFPAPPGPSVTKELIESRVRAEYYFTADGATAGSPQRDELKLLTICVLVLDNGFTVLGKSACASPMNFNEEKGRQLAREDAIRQIWALEGYLLKEQLFRAPAVEHHSV